MFITSKHNKILLLCGAILLIMVSLIINTSKVEAKEVALQNDVHHFVNQVYSNDELKDINKVYMKKYNISSLVTYNNLYKNNKIYLTYNEYFKNVKWIKRNGVVSLSITPKASLYNIKGGNAANIQLARANHSFKLLKNKFSKSSHWKNDKSLFNQYHCHIIFAGNKKIPWNIEPNRPAKSVSETIRKGCNP